MLPELSRRHWLVGTAGALATRSCSVASAADPIPPASNAEPFRYCLNTSTIRGQKLGIVAEAELASKAGYNGFEPWMGEIEDYVKKGGDLKDLGKRLEDLGLSLESAIGFAEWIVDDPARRKAGLETAKRDMAMVRTLGGKRIAAPPVGATNIRLGDTLALADRYADLAKIGQSLGIAPQIEVWGFSQTLRRLGETVLIAMESRCDNACVLPDIYHLYKGGSGFDSLKLLRGRTIGIFHLNDYPEIAPEKIGDADRVYPGDGTAPLKTVLRTLKEIGYSGMLSLELFNRDYWKREAAEVVATGLAKMKSVVREAMKS